VRPEYEEDHLETTYRGQIVKERRAFLTEYRLFKEEQQWGSFMIFSGMSLLFLGTCSLIVPLYKILCEKWGFSTKTSHQDYQVNEEDMLIHKKWHVHFNAKVDDDLAWLFKPEVKTVQIHAGETALVFYKAYNKSDRPIVGLSIY